MIFTNEFNSDDNDDSRKVLQPKQKRTPFETDFPIMCIECSKTPECMQLTLCALSVKFEKVIKRERKRTHMQRVEGFRSTAHTINVHSHAFESV